MLSGAGAPFANDKKIPRVSLSSVEVLEALLGGIDRSSTCISRIPPHSGSLPVGVGAEPVAEAEAYVRARRLTTEVVDRSTRQTRQIPSINR